MNKRPLVVVVADGSSGFGRGIVRGAMRYMNLQRRWQIRTELVLKGLPEIDWPRFDGALTGGASPDLIDYIRQRSRHLVVCSGSADPARQPVVSLDEYAVGVMAAEHLLECRIQQFAFHGNAGFGTSANRFKGFKEAVELRGFECTDTGMGWQGSTLVSEGDHLQRITGWLKTLKDPIGIMCVDDLIAKELATACSEAGLSVPDRVAIIGVNNDDLLCESAWPPISSVDGDYSRVGYAAASVLDRLMQGEKLRGTDRAIRFPPQRIVRRQSTDMLAIDDRNVADAVAYIRDHAVDPCSVGDVLQQVPVSRRWLERHFVNVLGRGPYDEIMRVRIETAKRLLLQPELKLEDISDRCGFSMIQQFRRAFVRATGTTPGAYRRGRLNFRS